MTQTLEGVPLESPSKNISRWTVYIALICLVPIPTLGVWFAAYGTPGAAGSMFWAFAKVMLIAGPIFFWVIVQRQKFPRLTVNMKGIGVGVVSGFALGLVILSSYWLIARPALDFSDISEVLAAAGISSVASYVALVLYLAVVNSLMEEYVFRWFLFKQLSQLMPAIPAVIASAAIFTVHHTVVVSAYVPWYFNVLISLGVFTGGLVWSYLYYRYGRIWPGYISHVIADIAVFIIGYDAIFLQ